MGVVISCAPQEIEETVDAPIDGSCKLLGDDVPLVVALYIEETALVVGIYLCLIEMPVTPNVLFQVAMTVDAVIALQF